MNHLLFTYNKSDIVSKCEKTLSILSVVSNKNNGLATLEVAYTLAQYPPNYFAKITISYFITYVKIFYSFPISI